MTDGEIWGLVDDDYDVSTLGNVRSWRSPGHSIPHLLKPGVDHKGKLFVYLGRERRRYVHHLVLDTFAGPRPEGLHGCHINDVPNDNRLSNLEWGTPKYNREQSRKNGTMCVGSKHPTSKLTEEKVAELRDLHQQGVGFSELGRMFGIHWVTARQAARRETWVHVK